MCPDGTFQTNGNQEECQDCGDGQTTGGPQATDQRQCGKSEITDMSTYYHAHVNGLR